MDNKSTATITWLRYYNFGSYLQAYGLQQTLIKLGYANNIIADEGIIPPKVTTPKRICLKIRSFIKILLLFFPIMRYKSKKHHSEKLYFDFRKKFLMVDEDSVIEGSLGKLDYNQYICGSDQIWHPLVASPLEPFYYAGFTKKKRIAYAASFGVSSYPDSRKSEFIELTKDFYSISCREKVGCQIIKYLLGKDVTYVLDPTLLLSGEQWRSVSLRPVGFNEEKYILTYFLTPNKWYVNYAREYARKRGLKLVTFYLRPLSPRECDETVVAGPSQFVWLVDHAEELFTDSFHGSVFASLLHTPFIGFCRFRPHTRYEGQNHRLEDLYTLMGVNDHFIRNVEDCRRIPNLAPLDFNMMESRLQSMKETSISFLKNSLNG